MQDILSIILVFCPSILILIPLLYGFRYGLPLKLICLGFLLFSVLGIVVDAVSYDLTGSEFNSKYFVYLNQDIFSFLTHLTNYIYVIIIFSIVVLLFYKVIFLLPRVKSFNNYILLLCISIFALGPFTSSGRILNDYLKYNKNTSKKLFLSAKADWSVKKPDLIFVYMESFDKLIADDYFLDNPIKGILNNSFIYSEIKSLKGSENSIHGLIGTLCGVPIEALGKSGYNSILNKFESDNLYCMSDLLSDIGYNLKFFSSTNLKFAGQSSFLVRHSFNIQDVETLSIKKKSPFGLFDRDLYDKFLQNYKNSLKKNKPLAYFLTPADTHIPGTVDDRCDLRDFSIKININIKTKQSHSFYCSLQALQEMQQNLIKMNPNSILVLVSDHLFPGKINTSYNSRRLLFLINSPLIVPGNNDNQGTIYDVIPTVLGKIGVKNSRVGIGVDLNKELSTVKYDNIENLLNGMDEIKVRDLIVRPNPMTSPKIENLHYDIKSHAIFVGSYIYKFPYWMHRNIKRVLKNNEIIIIRVMNDKVIFSKKPSKSIINLEHDTIYFGGTSSLCKLMQIKKNIKTCSISPFGIISKINQETYKAFNINESFTMSLK